MQQQKTSHTPRSEKHRSTIKPTLVKSAPVPLDASALKRVAGGSPNGGWSSVTKSPNGGW
jgi:hypothetical protein